MSATHDVETWENISEGKIMINKFSGKGDEVIQEAVSAGRQILLSPQERTLLNSDRCYSETVDPFTNGRLVPLTLASDSDDLEDGDSNPNHMLGSNLGKLFEVRNWKAFQSKMAEISSVPILQRMLAMADADSESEDNELNVTVKQVDTIKTRLGELIDAPDVQVIETYSG